MSKAPANRNLLLSVKILIEQARTHVVRNIDTTILLTYFQIGRLIVEDEQGGNSRANYAKETLKHLSKYLTKEFGRGYSTDNLQWMRRFYLAYRKYESVIHISAREEATHHKNESAIHKLERQPSAIKQSEIPFTLSWTHYIQRLKIENEEERKFYEIEAAQNNWSVRELTRQFNAAVYERVALSKDKKAVKALAKKGQRIENPTDVLKSHYVLEFLDLKEDHRYSESDLETVIINRLEHFMLELGKGFLFEGRQRRFIFGGEEFFVDLVFYNRLLKCFVLFDLKIGKLTHQDIGQMQMYVNYYDRKIKTKHETKQ